MSVCQYCGIQSSAYYVVAQYTNQIPIYSPNGNYTTYVAQVYVCDQCIDSLKIALRDNGFEINEALSSYIGDQQVEDPFE